MLRHILCNSRLNAGDPSGVGERSNHELANADKTQPKFEVVGLSHMTPTRHVVQPPHPLGVKLAAQGQLTDTGSC